MPGGSARSRQRETTSMARVDEAELVGAEIAWASCPAAYRAALLRGDAASFATKQAVMEMTKWLKPSVQPVRRGVWGRAMAGRTGACIGPSSSNFSMSRTVLSREVANIVPLAI
jgi:hypothetical protein